MTFKDFGGDIREIVLILINMHPDVEQVIIPGGTFGGGCQLYRWRTTDRDTFQRTSHAKQSWTYRDMEC